MNPGLAIGLLLVFILVLWFAGSCLQDLARTPDYQLRIFPKMAWAVLIIATIPLGGVLYLVYGKGTNRRA